MVDADHPGPGAGRRASTGNGYRSFLHDTLASEGHAEDFVGTQRNGSMADPDNEGHSGWRIDQIAGIADSVLAQYRPNYGMRYAVRARLTNPSAEGRTAVLTFGSDVTAATDVPGDTWNGAASVRVDGGAARIATLYVRPTVPRCEIGRYVLAPGASTLVELEFEVPGLITAGSQLLFESV
ncbi:hypothetical protein ACFVT9_07090 [Kitasatospora cineracea]|uniref:hypothetical protein n=1 Tax=Kitasatospora cineracea TaxID=88074 RepID=UPI0036D854B8